MKKSGRKEISKIKLVVFPGNPGIKYARTRHNLPWLLLDTLEQNCSAVWQKKFKGVYSKDLLRSGCIALKPETFMNKTGESVRAAADFFKLKPENILVCHDDIELEYGEADFKLGGGTAGHNGLRSVKQHTGSNEFYRFRLGVSRPERGGVDSHVLGRFTKDEEAVLSLYLEKASALLDDFLYGSSQEKLLKQKKQKLIPF